MELSDILPREAILAKVGEFTENVVSASAGEFIRDQEDAMSTVGLYVWDQMVARKVASDPSALRDIYPDRLEKLAQFIKKELGGEWLTDAFSTRLYSPLDPEYSFVDLTVVQCYPNDVHIQDIEFADLTRKLSRPKSGLGARTYQGLGVFGHFLDNIKMLARERGLDRISLMAASPAAHDVFTRYGFVVGDGALAQAAFDTLGYSHPMLLKV